MRTCSEETKKKISEAQKGRPRPYALDNKHALGYRHSGEVLRKISQASKNRIVSLATKAKMSLAQLGKRHSNETKKKISQAKIGRKLGPVSEETRRNMSMAQKGRIISEEHRKKIGDAKRGQRHTNETKRRMSVACKGSRCYNWKGGITSQHEIVRKSMEYKSWRGSCFVRDDFSCRRCKLRGSRLRVHHVNNFAEFPELRMSIDNGVTLCDLCHKEFHSRFGVKHNTKEQLEKFLAS